MSRQASSFGPFFAFPLWNSLGGTLSIKFCFVSIFQNFHADKNRFISGFGFDNGALDWRSDAWGWSNVATTDVFHWIGYGTFDPNPNLPLKMVTPTTTLRSSLEKHNDTFESLLKLIPAKYYIPQDNDDQVARS